MVTFIPPYLGEEIKSNAEKKMYDILQELKLKNTYVLHSLGLPKHRSKIYGEVDFVVVCDRGVACLEIKGGRVECREGKWIFTDRYGVEREKPEGPFAQVTGNMCSLRDALKKRFQKDENNKNVLMACGVVFPDIEFKSRGQEIIPEIVFDAGTDDITAYINSIFDYWQPRQHKTTECLSPAAIKEIVDYLRGDFVFVPTLSSRLNDVEKRLIRLTKEQVMLMDALSMNERLLIEGRAGTGKTLLAVDYAKKQAEQGKKVLYLTFNKNLANHVKQQASEYENLYVFNIHALFGEYVPVDTEQIRTNPKEYFAKVLPEAFYGYISGLSEDEAEKLRYDLLVMDEGQDILNPLYLYSLDALLTGGFHKGRWAVFYDGQQNIYNPDYTDGMEILKSYPCAMYRLFINCRNTVQIGTYSAKVSGMELGDFIRENGEDVQRITYTDTADFKKKMKDILKELRAGEVDRKEIVFLGAKKFKNSMLHEAGMELNELGDDFDATIDLPVYSTIQGFKGLDAKVVILTDVEWVHGEMLSKYLYIAGTRARTLLYVVGSEEFWERDR